MKCYESQEQKNTPPTVCNILGDRVFYETFRRERGARARFRFFGVFVPVGLSNERACPYIGQDGRLFFLFLDRYQDVYSSTLGVKGGGNLNVAWTTAKVVCA